MLVGLKQIMFEDEEGKKLGMIKPNKTRKHSHWRDIELEEDETLIGFAGGKNLTSFKLIVLKHW